MWQVVGSRWGDFPIHQIPPTTYLLVHKPYREWNPITAQGDIRQNHAFRGKIVLRRKPKSQQGFRRKRHPDERGIIHALGVVTSPEGNEIRCDFARRFIQRNRLDSGLKRSSGSRVWLARHRPGWNGT